MSKTFFIDSENVGDNWTQLLDAVDTSDELLVFYTQKSPHMSYKNLIKLKNSPKDVNFIECFEGNNALDFQLVSELGYRLGQGIGGNNEYFIVSNDNGFEAAIKYWKRKGFPVRRFNSKACASISTLLKETNETVSSDEITSPETIAAEEQTTNDAQETDPVKAEEAIKSPVSSVDADDMENNPVQISVTEAETQDGNSSEVTAEVKTQDEDGSEVTAEVKAQDGDGSEVAAETSAGTNPAQAVPADDSRDAAETEAGSGDAAKADIIETILNTEPEPITVDDISKSVYYCIGKDNLANLHEALMQLYGNDKCKVLYNTFKSDSAYRKIPAEYKKMSPEERQQMYCNIVYTSAGFEGTLPDDFAQTVMKAWKSKQNLNSLRAALERRFGKVNGKQSYVLIKAHIKILDNIS